MKDFIQIEDIAELVKLNNNRSIKLFSDSNTYNINIVEFFNEKYIVNKYAFNLSYYEKQNQKEHNIKQILEFSNSNMILVKDFLFFLKNHYNVILTNYKYSKSNYNSNIKIYEKYIKRKTYTLIKDTEYKTNTIIKTNKFDYFIDDTNKLIIVTRVSENISDQELKKLVISNSSYIMSEINDFKRTADSYKRNLDRLEQSINFIQNNYSELVI